MKARANIVPATRAGKEKQPREAPWAEPGQKVERLGTAVQELGSPYQVEVVFLPAGMAGAVRRLRFDEEEADRRPQLAGEMYMPGREVEKTTLRVQPGELIDQRK